ncbi:porin [Dongia deserti]|uniref:porin n=1 Tax=Dongia deserti TaxID=2268030 RepID=UPI0013C3FB73|nr:porin [Dongia deserti]
MVVVHAGRSVSSGVHVTKTLLVSTALLGVGAMASPAAAIDDVALSPGGFFENAYMATSDDSGEGDLGYEQVSGSFGEVRVGADDALPNTCVVAPGGTSHFSAFALNPWDPDALTSSACAGVDNTDDAQTFVYMTPAFAGFQLALSYMSRGGTEVDAARGLTGLPTGPQDEPRQDVLLYSTYSFEGDGWDLSAGLGSSFAGEASQEAGPDRSEQTFYQAGLNLTVGDFAAGAVFEYYKDLVDRNLTDLDRWVAGAGIAYTMDAWTFGAQYAHMDQNGDAAADELQQDRFSLTGSYAFGPGVNIDGEIGYRWIEADPEADTTEGIEADDGSALEIGIGTNFTF